jgi:hypothetical protein
MAAELGSGERSQERERGRDREKGRERRESRASWHSRILHEVASSVRRQAGGGRRWLESLHAGALCLSEEDKGKFAHNPLALQVFQGKNNTTPLLYDLML